MAAAATKRKPAAHPRRCSGQSPHVNARIAGASPNDTTSASESSSTPNADVEFVSRAKNPSSVSRTIAIPMNRAAVSKSERVEYTTHEYPQNRFETVNRDGSRKPPRRNRCGLSSRRRFGALAGTAAPQESQHGFATDHALADRHA